MKLTFFHSKKIIYTDRWKPAVFVKSFSRDGQKFIRLAFPNLVKFAGYMPMTDVYINQVTGIRKLPSPFKKLLYRSVGLRAKPKFYQIHRIK